MNNNEWPPQETEVEAFKDERELQPNTTKEQRIKDILENANETSPDKITISEADKIAKIQQELKIEPQIKEALAKRIPGDEVWEIPKTETVPSNKFRNFAMAAKIILAGLFGLASTKSEANNGPLNDSTKNKIENIKGDFKDSLSEKKNTVNIYTGGKTKEGSITPTGFDNSFYNNEYGVTEADLPVLAEKYNFSKDNFQNDMVEYVQKNKPQIITGVLEKFGPTNYATENNISGYKGLEDGNFGLRMAYIVSELNKEIKKDSPELKNIVPSLEQPKDKVFNLDNYSRLVVLFDASPSMNTKSHKEILAADLKDNVSDIPVEIVTFTNKIESQTTATNPSSAAEMLKNVPIVEQDQELGLKVLNEKINLMEKTEGKTLVVVCTDEQLQGVSEDLLNSLKESSVNKNLDIEFSIMLDGNKIKISLNELNNIYQNKYKTSVESKVAQDKKAIEIRKRIISDPTTNKEEILNSTQEIKSFEEAIKRHSMVNISDFKTTGSEIASN
jgi:hypothetical protein